MLSAKQQCAMTKTEINDRLKEIIEIPFSLEIQREGNNLLTAYQSAAALEHKEQLEKYIEEGGQKEDFVLRRGDLDLDFDKLWAKYQQNQKAWLKQKEDEESRNKTAKEDLIKQIEALVDEENIKLAIERIREIEQKWKEIGSVPQEIYRDIQQSYSRVRDEFYYNLRIHKELLEHDLKRNLQLKEELAEKAESLNLNLSVKELEDLIRAYSAEWDEIGPTFHDKWEAVRDRFRAAQKKVYEKIRDHYKSVKEKLNENLERKIAICEKIEEINQFEITTDKRWKKLSEEVIQLQKDWKSAGLVPRKENDAVWERFKIAADGFFERRNAFYNAYKQEQDKHKETKKKLIEEAELLKDSNDWKEASNRLIVLQKEWKQVGPANQRDEQRLWKQFRSACNAFFERKQTYFDTKDERFAGNYEAKKKIIADLEALALVGNSNQDISAIDALVDAFAEIGFVPAKNKAEITTNFRNALINKYKEMELDQDSVQKLLYFAKIKDIASSEDAKDELSKEQRAIYDKIKILEATVIQYSNNLGFFSDSKGSEKLKKEVEGKIKQNEVQIDMWKDRLQLIKRVIGGNLSNPYVVSEENETEGEQESNTNQTEE